MKKNLLMLMSVFAFICVGVSVASAKTLRHLRTQLVSHRFLRLLPIKLEHLKQNVRKGKEEVVPII